MKASNSMRLCFDSRSANESFARTAVAAFLCGLDPTVEELTDVKTAVSEAVTNCIVHAYREKIDKVYITASIYPDSRIVIKIKDNGCGIPAEHLPNVKKKFYKANQTVRGSGIGLALADEIMRLHAGSLEIESHENVGTAVTITIPVLTEDREERNQEPNG